MSDKLKGRLTYANVMSTIAVFAVIAGGTALAGGSRVPGKGGVNSADIRNGKVKSIDVRDDGLTGTDIDEATLQPAGMVAFFNLAACPAGWVQLTAAQGRYLVGLSPGGSLGGAVGTALVNLQDRSVGQHSHGITDPGHDHVMSFQRATSFSAASAAYGQGAFNGTESFPDTSDDPTNVTVNNAGGVAGTNAPYLQFLVCQKG